MADLMEKIKNLYEYGESTDYILKTDGLTVQKLFIVNPTYPPTYNYAIFETQGQLISEYQDINTAYLEYKSRKQKLAKHNIRTSGTACNIKWVVQATYIVITIAVYVFYIGTK